VFFPLALHAQDLLPVPRLSGRVVDLTSTLTANQQLALGAKLQTLESKMGTQVVVLMVPSVKPEDIADFAQRVGDVWKIGRRKEGDGLLLVVAKSDRKIRIQVAKALEGAIPDVAAARIIQNMMTPAFKAGDYAGGLNQAIDALGLRIQADGTPPPGASAPETETMPNAGATSEAPSTWSILLLLIPISGAFFLFVIVIGRKIGVLYIGGLVGVLVSSITKNWVIALGLAFIAMLTMFIVNLFARNTTAPVVSQRARSRAHSSSGAFWGAVASSGSWGAGSDSGSSNDSFSSGGGGDFGGGGASGDW
jgi:uncharacterized protein